MRLSQLASPEFKAAVDKLMAAQLPIKTTFKLKKLVLALEPEVKIFHETRESIVKAYGEKNEDGSLKADSKGMVQLDILRVEEWKPKLSELMMLESTVELTKFSLSDFGDQLQLSANELFALGDLIQED